MAVTHTARKPRHIPTRMCLSCKETRPKRELIRVVRTPEGGLEVDPKGKKSGRGAYLCQHPQCWQDAFKKKKLGYSLKMEVSADDKARLMEFAKTLSIEEGRV